MNKVSESTPNRKVGCRGHWEDSEQNNCCASGVVGESRESNDNN